MRRQHDVGPDPQALAELAVRPDDGPAFALVVLTRTDEPHEDAERRIADVAAEAWGRRR